MNNTIIEKECVYEKKIKSKNGKLYIFKNW